MSFTFSAQADDNAALLKTFLDAPEVKAKMAELQKLGYQPVKTNVIKNGGLCGVAGCDEQYLVVQGLQTTSSESSYTTIKGVVVKPSNDLIRFNGLVELSKIQSIKFFNCYETAPTENFMMLNFNSKDNPGVITVSELLIDTVISSKDYFISKIEVKDSTLYVDAHEVTLIEAHDTLHLEINLATNKSTQAYIQSFSIDTPIGSPKNFETLLCKTYNF